MYCEQLTLCKIPTVCTCLEALFVIKDKTKIGVLICQSAAKLNYSWIQCMFSTFHSCLIQCQFKVLSLSTRFLETWGLGAVVLQLCSVTSYTSHTDKALLKKSKVCQCQPCWIRHFQTFFPPLIVMNFETLRALDCFNLFTVFMPSHRNLLPYGDSYHIL